MEKKTTSKSIFLRVILIIIGIIFLSSIAFFLIPYLITNKSWYWNYSQETGVIGDTIGGIVGPIVGFIGVIFTFFAFYIQYKANQIQIKMFEFQSNATKTQQIENNFYELLKLHRENVNEIWHRKKVSRNAIEEIVVEFYEILEIVKSTTYFKNIHNNNQDIANISFLILFFGLSNDATKHLKNSYLKKYENQIQGYNHFVNWMNDNNKIVDENGKRTIKFNGHQSRLGHYFRHLYRTVNYIHLSATLKDEEKINYIELLRTQLSTHEQILLFFNSISDLGLNWEHKENKLISKYNLIKNVPLGYMKGYDPRTFYPNLILENDFVV